MDTVLGVSMAPTTVRMVLVEGQDGNGVIVEQDNFDVPATAPLSASERVISAILGTREGAAESGYDLRSTGVTWTDPTEAAQLRDALAAHKMENVMLVSAFLAAAALAQEVGNAVGYSRTGLVFVEPDTATMAIVETADGSITDVRREPLTSGDTATELAALVRDMQTSAASPDGLYLVGSGVDIAPLKPRLEATTPLPVTVPEEPDTALARGAALASAHAPLFSSATEALAYARDPGTGAIDPYAVAPAYQPDFDAPLDAGGDALAYSALADDEADAYTAVADQQDHGTRRRMPVPLLVSAVAAIFVVGAVALAVALVATMRPTPADNPNPERQVVPGTQLPEQAKPPAPPAAPTPPEAPAPAEVPARAEAPAPAPAAPAPAAPAPVAPAPAPAAPAPAPVAPAPEAPPPVAPAPAPPPAAPAPVPIPIPVGPPGHGPFNPGHGGGGWGPGGGHGSGGPGGGGGGGGIPGLPNIPGIPGL